MKAIFIFLSLWAVSLTAGAQNRNVEQAIREFLAIPGITTSESIVRERDLSQPLKPMKSMCEVWDFTCDASLLSYIEHLSSYMKANSSSEQCYYVKTHTPGRVDWHDILVGDDPTRVVELGRSERCHYTLVNFIDTLDTAKCHRYAYALEWQEQNIPFKLKEQNGKLVKRPVTEKTYKGKVVITYARMPQTNAGNTGLVIHNAKFKYDNLQQTMEDRLGILQELMKHSYDENDIADLLRAWKQWIDDVLDDKDE